MSLFIVIFGLFYFYTELVAIPRAQDKYREECMRQAERNLDNWLRQRKERPR